MTTNNHIGDTSKMVSVPRELLERLPIGIDSEGGSHDCFTTAARHTTTIDGGPLVILYGLPGGPAELTPEQICSLARELKQHAIDAARIAADRRYRAKPDQPHSP